MTEPERFRIDWEPLGIRSEAQAGITLLEAARKAGLRLAAYCGGVGTCGSCRVTLREGVCSPVTETEKSILSASEIDDGFRLACQARVLGRIKLQIPVTSLTSEQRLQLEGTGFIDLGSRDPVLKIYDLAIPEPGIGDLRSDSKRLCDALKKVHGADVSVPPDLLYSLSDDLRKINWEICAAVRGNELAAVLPGGASVYGLAIDIGTTKIAAYLLDMRMGLCVEKDGIMNPQIGYGEDVVSRIAYSQTDPPARDELHRVLVSALNELIGNLCQKAGCSPVQIADAVVVCNTAIHHFFVNLPTRQLGLYPFVPAVSDALCLPASFIGLHMAPGASVYLPRNIAGYVGADHVSMLVGIRDWQSGINRVAVDVGTNTEISLATRDGRTFCCSCASGPAFEGAHIRNGMRAASGAIEKAAFFGTGLHYRTIGDCPAVGICGSGILDLVFALKNAGAVSESGKFDPEFPGVEKLENQLAYKITDQIYVTRSDINEIILAKSAIRTGIEILLLEAGLQDEDIDLFTVAGAFGTYLDLNSAVGIGMFPDIPMERFEQVGNAAGSGAQRMLLSISERKRGEQIAEQTKYVELTCAADFKSVYVRAMNLKRGRLKAINR